MESSVNRLMKDYTAGLRKIYGNQFLGAWLYGSYARQEEDRESDVDVIIILEKIDRYGAEIDRTSELTASIALQYGLSISRVFVTGRDWELSDNPFLQTVRGEAVPA